MIAIVLLSVAVIALAMLGMAVGTLFSRRCLRGSCGALGASDELACEVCPLRSRSERRHHDGG